MELKDILKKKFELLILICVSIITDVIPVILVMVGIWITKYAARMFGFENFMLTKALTTFSEVFMVVLYLLLVSLSIHIMYKLFKEGKL